MIINDTTGFTRMRHGHCTEPVLASVQPLRDAFTRLNLAVAGFEKRLSRHALPSFSSRQKRDKEVEAHRAEIDGMIREIEGTIKECRVSDPNMRLSIQTYFLQMLKRAVIAYRAMHQEALKRQEVHADLPPAESPADDGHLLTLTISRVSHIRQSVYALTNTLLELKMALKNQTEALDRIDFHFGNANYMMERAHAEIEKIPGSISGFKDFVLYCLIYVLGVLLALALLKMFMRR